VGGQAQVSGVAAPGNYLTDNVNFMPRTLTDQVRGIVKVVTAVADGNPAPEADRSGQRQVAALAETIHNMTDTLATFARAGHRVAREGRRRKGLEARPAFPARPARWSDLTDNAPARRQLRPRFAPSPGPTAVDPGRLDRSIQVDAKGEVAELKTTSTR